MRDTIFEPRPCKTPARKEENSVDNRFDEIDDAAIQALVDRFYAKVRRDPALGPVFEAAIADWGPHLRTMYDFWSSVMLTTGRYKGNPLMKHMRLPGITPGLFETWLRLFAETAEETVAPPLAARFVEKARRIAQSLQLGLFYRPDGLRIVAAPPR
jgi:hemoglobin